MTTRPGPQVCHLCVLDEFLRWEVEGPGLWRYTCANPSCDGYSWLTSGKDPLKTGSYDGIVRDLGILDDLADLFTDAGWEEYGVVEYRYAVANPSAYKQLVGMFSHTAVERPLQNSASAFIGMCLGMLEREGVLTKRQCKATGYWKYNDIVTAWARRGVDPNAPILTWADFATTHGLDPDAWVFAGPAKHGG